MGYLKNYQFGYGLSVFKSGCGSNKVTLRLLAVALCIPLIAFAAEEQTPSALVYEIAINNGRVIDPETKLDAQRNIGILNGKIATITGEKITAQRTINARGKIVAPGFIDTHVHAPDLPLNQRMLARDGVTTALDLENGAYPFSPLVRPARWQQLYQFRRQCQFNRGKGSAGKPCLQLHHRFLCH